MRTHFFNQGQISTGIIILVVLSLIIGGGLFYYFQKETPETPKVIEKETVEPEESITPFEEEKGEEKIEEKIISPTEEIITPPKSEKPTVQKCTDGTPYGKCSLNKPKYCENGTLSNKASLCGCPEGYEIFGELCVLTQTIQGCRVLSEPMKDHSKAIDIVIIGADKITESKNWITDLDGQTRETITKVEQRYSDKPKQLLLDAQILVNDFLSVEPFNQYQNIFNFYLASETTEWGSLRSQDSKDWEEIAQDCRINYDIVAGLINSGYEEIRTFDSVGGCGGGSQKGNVIEVLQCIPTFVHEIGHVLGLPDRGYFTIPGPGVYKGINVCGKPSCEEIGEMEGTGKWRDYKYTDTAGGTCCYQLYNAPMVGLEEGMSEYYTTNEKSLMNNQLELNVRHFALEEKEYLKYLFEEIIKKGYSRTLIYQVKNEWMSK